MQQNRLIAVTAALACFLSHSAITVAEDHPCAGCNAGNQAANTGLAMLCRNCDSCRAGCPDQVAWYARPNATPGYCGYFVGGGAAVGGGGRCSPEGTWGWDYFGSHFRRLVALNWWHSRRPCANREGSYATD